MTVDTSDFLSVAHLAPQVALSWSHPAARLARELWLDLPLAVRMQPEYARSWHRMRCQFTQDNRPCFCGQHAAAARA